MNVQTFSNTQEMEAFLAKAKHSGLHPLQEALTYGDHFVQFHDIAEKHIIFGRVETLEQIALDNLAGPDGRVRAGVQWDDVMATVMDFDAKHQKGLLYAEMFDRFNETGDGGYASKAHVWPIEKRLFNMAATAEWKIEDLDDAGRILLDIAFAGMRAHLRGAK